MYQVSGLALADKRSADWDKFVKSSTDGSFFHLAGWQQVLADLGHQGFYLYATLDQKIVGVLPLARVKSRLFGDALVSTPFCVYGGALGEDDVKRHLEQSAIISHKIISLSPVCSMLLFNVRCQNRMQTFWQGSKRNNGLSSANP